MPRRVATAVVVGVMLAVGLTLVPPAPKPVAAATVSLDSPVARLRVDLDRLLAEHAFLTIEQMRSGLTGGSDFQAAAAAVEANTVDLVGAVGSIYGSAAGDEFGSIWRSHIGYVVDYAVALGKHDVAGRQKALDGLEAYRARFLAFLKAANPGVSLAGVGDALKQHDAQLVGFIDAVGAGDPTSAYAIERRAYPHMFDIGDTLARVIAARFPARFGGLDVAYSAAGSLRVTLDRILGEHSFLAAEAMRAGVAGQASYDAARGALDGNSDDLQGLIAAAYGDPAAKTFRGLWDKHIADYVAYIDATNANDQAKRATDQTDLAQDAGQLSGFLAAANPNLDPTAVADMLRQHIGHLTGQVDAFRAGDATATYQLVREGYRHMFAVGEVLAGAIATQLPAQFPARAAAPQTTMIDAAALPVPLRAFVLGLRTGFALVRAFLGLAALPAAPPRAPTGLRPSICPIRAAATGASGGS
jgi:hypothetical protein